MSCRIQIRPDISRTGQAGPNGLFRGYTGVIPFKVESNQSHPEGLRHNQFQNKVKRTHLRVGFGVRVLENGVCSARMNAQNFCKREGQINVPGKNRNLVRVSQDPHHFQEQC